MSSVQKSRLVQFSSTELFSEMYCGIQEEHCEHRTVSDERFFNIILEDQEKFSKIFIDELLEVGYELEKYTDPIHTGRDNRNDRNRPKVEKDVDKITMGIFSTVFNLEDYRKCDDARDYILPIVIEQLNAKGADYFYDCLEKTWKNGYYPGYAYIPAGDVETLIEIIKTCTGGYGWRT